MKTLAVTGLIVVALATGSAAPTYEVTRWVGDHDFLFSFRGESQSVFGPSQNDALSTWQALPFAWKFFGDDVNGYFISDNGYITFDREATSSVPVSTALPDAAAPAGSIFAFWTDIRLEAPQGQWDNRVWTATMGAAPNRVHVIYWLSVVPAPDTFSRAGYNFALALYENGSFEVIFTSGRKGTPVKATIGALSKDRMTAVVAAGPGIDYPDVGYGGDDDVNYLFKPAVVSR